MADPVLKRDRAAHYRLMALDALRQAANSVNARQRDMWLQVEQNCQAKAAELEAQNDRAHDGDFYSALASVLTRAT